MRALRAQLDGGGGEGFLAADGAEDFELAEGDLGQHLQIRLLIPRIPMGRHDRKNVADLAAAGSFLIFEADDSRI